MLVSFIFSSCVKQCQLVCTQNGSWIRSFAKLNRVKTRRGVSKTQWCHTFSNVSNHSVKWKVSKRRIHKRSWCIQCWWLLWTLRHCVWSNGMLLLKLFMSRNSSFSHWRRSSGCIRKNELEELQKKTYKKRVVNSLRCTEVVGGKCRRQIMFQTAYEWTFLIQYASQRRMFFGNCQIWKSIW